LTSPTIARRHRINPPSDVVGVAMISSASGHRGQRIEVTVARGAFLARL
jgi:hypothetical protein